MSRGITGLHWLLKRARLVVYLLRKLSEICPSPVPNMVQKGTRRMAPKLGFIGTSCMSLACVTVCTGLWLQGLRVRAPSLTLCFHNNRSPRAEQTERQGFRKCAAGFGLTPPAVTAPKRRTSSLARRCFQLRSYPRARRLPGAQCRAPNRHRGAGGSWLACLDETARKSPAASREQCRPRCRLP